MSENWTSFFSRVQKDVLMAHLDSWCDIEQSTAPANRPAAERAVTDAYAILNLPAPKFAWCESPQTMALSRAIVETIGNARAADARESADGNGSSSYCGKYLKGRIRNEALVESEDRLMKELDISAIVALVKISGSKGWRADTLSVDETFGIIRPMYDRAPQMSLVTMNDGRGAALPSQLAHALNNALQIEFRKRTISMANIETAVHISAGVLGNEFSDEELTQALQYYELRNSGSFVNLLQRAVIESCYGNLDARFLALPSFFREHHDLKWQTDRVRPLIELARHCGGFLPHERVCWMLEKPRGIHVDDQSRLHSENGPAIEYKDWGTFCWHGIVVERQIVMEPETITVKNIETELNLEIRRIMLARFGETRFIEESGAVIVDEDPDFGVLYRKVLPRDEPLQMVKVRNSTPEPDGTIRNYLLRVPPTMRTAREAVAWTFRMTEQQYQPQIET